MSYILTTPSRSSPPLARGSDRNEWHLRSMGNIKKKKEEEGMCGSKHTDDSEKHCAPLNSPKQSAFPPFSCSVALLLFCCLLAIQV